MLTFLNPERDPLGQGWNIIQSKIAVGSGGLFGKGWAASTQSHLEFLPEPHTDFIFSVLAEEFGFVGVLTVLLLFGPDYPARPVPGQSLPRRPLVACWAQPLQPCFSCTWWSTSPWSAA